MGNETLWLKIIASFVFAVGAVLFSVLSFTTNNWNVYLVDRDGIKNEFNTITSDSARTSMNESLYNEYAYKSRYRGLIRLCFTTGMTDLECLPEEGYELSPNEKTVNYGLAYRVRIHLLRLWFALHLLAAVLFIIGIIFASWTIFQKRRKLFWVTASFFFSGSLMNAFSMATYQVVDYLEKDQIKDNLLFYAKAKDEPYLGGNISYDYGYSYMLGWAGLAMGLLAAMMFLSTAGHYGKDGLLPDEKRSLTKSKRKWYRRNKQRHHPYNTYSSSGKDYIMEKYYANLPTIGAVSASPYMVYDPASYDYDYTQAAQPVVYGTEAVGTEQDAYRSYQELGYRYPTPEVYGTYY